LYPHDNMICEKNQSDEVLSDKSKTGKERPWRVHKMNTIKLAESYERLGEKKAYRVKDCGTFLEFKNYGNEKRLNRANFCKVRLCPMCGWRRSLKVFGQVSKVMDQALQDREYRFLFLTLTCKNVEGDELGNSLDMLFKAFKRLMERKKVKTSIKGWFRALEVTHNLDKNSPNYDSYHPHFHVILMVNRSYFNDPNYYISQTEWIALWKKSLGVDYDPNIDIRAFKSASKEMTSKSIAEVATYTVKDNDLIIQDENGEVNEEMTDDAVFILDRALARRRLVAFGGELKLIHKELNLDDTIDGDLIQTDNDEIREDLAYTIERYKWNIGYSQYYIH